MERVQTISKLMLNKRTVSMLQSPAFLRNIHLSDTKETTRYTIGCTDPECASEPGCRTDHLQSCAPCVPPGYTRGNA